MNKLGQGVIDLAISLLVGALLFSWTWSVVRPLIPVLAGIGAVLLVFAFVRRRRGY